MHDNVSIIAPDQEKNTGVALMAQMWTSLLSKGRKSETEVFQMRELLR